MNRDSIYDDRFLLTNNLTQTDIWRSKLENQGDEVEDESGRHVMDVFHVSDQK